MRTRWSFYGTIPTALFNHLTAQVAGDVRDMYPPPVALPNQLGKLDAPLLMHLLYYFEQLAMIGSVTRNDIGGTAEEMGAILGASHQGVELFAAIAAAHHDRLAPRFAYRVEELVY